MDGQLVLDVFAVLVGKPWPCHIWLVPLSDGWYFFHCAETPIGPSGWICPTQNKGKWEVGYLLLAAVEYLLLCSVAVTVISQSLHKLTAMPRLESVP